jgi:iron complex outermembrane recepter protein
MKFAVAPAMAFVVFVAAASASGQEAGVARENSPGGRTELLEAQGAQDQRAFDIPAQPLGGALNAFGRQSGLQVTVDSSLAAGVQSQAVAGTMTSAEALDRLLAGTGIAGRFTGNRTVVLTKPSSGVAPGVMQLDPVQVQANVVPQQAIIDNVPAPYAGGQVASGGQIGLFGNRSVMDTPFSQTSYTAQTLQDQQARTVTDVLANNPSVRMATTETSFVPSTYIRGFFVSPWDIALNGLYGVVPGQTISPDFVERVEVLLGPSALLSGLPPQGSVGGMINIVPKRAEETPITRATTTYASNSQFGEHIDVGRRFGDDHEWGFRFNGSYRRGNTAVDNQSQELGVAALGLDYRGKRARIALDLGYQRQYATAPFRNFGINPGIPIPAAPSASSNVAQPWTYSDIEDRFGVLRGEFDLSESWTFYGAAGGRTTRSTTIGGRPTITNALGGFSNPIQLIPFLSETNSEEVGIRGHFDTGPIHHQLSLNANRLFNATSNQAPTLATASSNIYNPVFVAAPTVPFLNPNRVSETLLYGYGFGHTMSAAEERVQLIWGLRRQEIEARNYNTTTGVLTSSYYSGALTPAVGLVVKPWQNVSFYASYIQGLQPGTIVPSNYTNAGQVLPPFVSTQYEVGAKVDWGRVITTLALFQISQPSGSANTTTNTFTADAEQRNRGIELNSFGQLTDTVRVLGGVTLLQGRLVRTPGGLYDGNAATGVPDVQMNIGTEWDTPFLRGLTLSGRAIYTSAQYYDIANTQQVPGWVRFDVGARYAFEMDGKPISIKANVLNVGNNNYWESANSTFGLALGAPRTFLVSASFDF